MISLPFPQAPNARAALSSGYVYAIDGGDEHIYYGQVAPDKTIGFFRFRSRMAYMEGALLTGLLSRFRVAYPSIGRALREGKWLALGRLELHKALGESASVVQWPVGTIEVSVWHAGKIVKTTVAHDPEIQNFEVMAVYDAIEHVPARLKADFANSNGNFSMGGPVWRERHLRQAMASRFEWHKLPKGWVSV